jgi:hypothetical protein
LTLYRLSLEGLFARVTLESLTYAQVSLSG